MKDNIAVSILDAKDIKDFINNLKKIDNNINELKLKTKTLDNIIHFDVMDNKFVPNTGIDLKYIKDAKKLGFYADIHLMVSDPINDGYIEKAIKYGADSITIHYEIENFEETLKYLIKRKKEILQKENREISIGVALKPKTKNNVLKKYISKIDKVLFMSVEPGFGGQNYIKEINDKITFFRNDNKKIILQVDGGVNVNTFSEVIRREVNSFVIGSYFTSSSSFNELYDKILLLNSMYTIEKTPRRANLKLDTTTLQVVPGGYGENDILLGINVPDIRKCALVWYKFLNYDSLELYITSKYHDYRRFAIFCIINKVSVLYKKVINNKKDKVSQKEINELFKFFETNIKYVNNWDLTDVAGPNILAYNLYLLNEKQRKKKVYKYLNNKNFWVKRIGIVSMLNFVRNGNIKLPLEICESVLYDEFHLFQKATGWVLREIYKKEPKTIVKFLTKKNKEKKLPTILLSYACEKMTSEEKDKIRKEGIEV